MSRHVRVRPWLPDAEAVARIIAAGNEKDDEIGSVKERRTTARRDAKANGHRLYPWKFQGSRSWTTYCASCMTIVIVDDLGTQFGAKVKCLPCPEAQG